MTKLRVGITTLVSLFASFPVFAEMGIDEKKGKAILEKVRKELIDEGRY